jgi:DNA polymerase epsilon subunit 1
VYLLESAAQEQDTNASSANAGFDLFDDDSRDNDKHLNITIADASDFIVDMREWDVPYHVRVLIDKGNSYP